MFEKTSNTVRLGLGLIALLLVTACSGGSTTSNSSDSDSGVTLTAVEANVTEEVGENPTKPIKVEIKGARLIEPGLISTFRFETTESVVDQEWKVDGVVASYDDELKTSLKEGKHTISVKVTGEKNNGVGSKKVIVKQADTVHWVNIRTEISLSEIESAQYYSVDDSGQMLTYKVFDEGDFRQEAGVLSLPLEVASDEDSNELYSHLTIYLKNGNCIAYGLRDGNLEELPLTMILTEMEESIDEMSGLHSLYFKVDTSNKVNPDQISSCKAIVDGEIVDSNYERFHDRTVYEWDDGFFKIKSFALGYGDSNVSRTSLCLEVQAEKDPMLVCSDMR